MYEAVISDSWCLKLMSRDRTRIRTSFSASISSPAIMVRRCPQLHSNASARSRRKLNVDFDAASRVVAHSTGDFDSSIDGIVDEVDGLSTNSRIIINSSDDELVKTKTALAEVRSREEAIQKERDHLLEELAHSNAKQQEYAAMVKHDKEVAIAELEAAKNLFSQQLQKSVEDRFALESKLVLAKQDAVELAVQVEKLAELAFEQATSHILEDARQRVAAAETSAAEAAYRIDQEIRNATEATIASIIDQSTDTINKALAAALEAGTQAQKAFSTISSELKEVDKIDLLESKNLGLQSMVRDLESKLSVTKSEVEKLKIELEQALALAKASDVRASAAEAALSDLQEQTQKNSAQRDDEMKALLEKVKKEAIDRENTITKAFKSELDGILAAIKSAKETSQLKDQAYSRRFNALERSLRSAEVTSEIWKQRAEMAETILQSEHPLEEFEGGEYYLNGGRMGLLVPDDKHKQRLLVEGPRREIPEWMARRIKTICPKFPPREVDMEKVLSAETLSLSLPKLEEVWSIVQEKPKEADVLLERVVEKETIEKKRKLLERALQRKTLKWQRIPEKIKLEPGTGSGREIVFQGFNWESWRRTWYLELAQKAADLSQTGITAVWLPPPTQSVAPQGYMPTDLYNLNSAYGTEEELKQCIEEMHSHDLLALGDVVLNHRCAQKQSPNGVWNIFGGKLAWGPEAIVCDDPNFHGRGNPSTGDIFHAAPNIDHSQEFVRNDIKNWLNWLRNDIGFDGWRLDFARGFSGGYVKEYIEASNPAFAIGEYWDSLSYEGGNLSYNQDAHRQRIVNWINATGGTSSAFDVTTKGILHCALHYQYWRLIDPQGKPTGVMGWWPSRAVTFLENHDTGSTQAHWPFPRDKLSQGYAYILTHPGTPVVFFDHFYDFGLRDTITELIDARARAGIHCRSNVKIFHANNEGYVARMDESLILKLGHFGWSPSKENNLEGTWQKFLDRGADYQVWLRQ